MRIGLCDDDNTHLHYIKYLIENWALNEKEKCSISIYNNSEQLLFEYHNSFPFDLIILDIQMGDISGIELAKIIREVDQDIFIIFLTGISNHVFEGYEVSALRYLLKPINEEQFYNLITKVKNDLLKEKDYIIIPFQRDLLKINLEKIIYIESIGHYLIIKTIDDEFEIKGSIKNIYKKLGDSFIFSHRSFIINILHIDQITKTNCTLNKKFKIPISRNLYKDINEAFIKYYQGSKNE